MFKNTFFCKLSKLQHLCSPCVWKLSLSACLFKSFLLVCSDWSALSGLSTHHPPHHVSALALPVILQPLLCWGQWLYSCDITTLQEVLTACLKYRLFALLCGLTFDTFTGFILQLDLLSIQKIQEKINMNWVETWLQCTACFWPHALLTYPVFLSSPVIPSRPLGMQRQHTTTTQAALVNSSRLIIWRVEWSEGE